MTGKIVKGIAGFYYVYVAGSGIYQCKARGIFRKDGIKPLTGDNVEMEITHEADREGSITRILQRKNEMVRPPVANVDQALILFSMRTPDPVFSLLDRILLSAALRNIPCAVFFNKAEEAGDEEKQAILYEYRGAGCPVHFISVKENTGIDIVRDFLRGKTTVLAGPSGVGKSSLTNALTGSVRMEVGEISKKLARGKNTTRHSELIYICEDTWIVDTPGFMAFDAENLAKEELGNYYPEFDPYRDSCYFQVCSHIHEPSCRVREAVESGEVSRTRYEQYIDIYRELEERERRRYK
ncbi:MAG: ribosome small subunit-dependent GTPase A [Lachnospiraceae bacterium]|nr:ribosome small subunit-dependent GTPase A [Lachnospiraceae bacterium]